MLHTYILPISKRVRQTPHAISLHFAQPKVDRIPYYAGQYITLKAKIDGKTHFRSYSMSSSPQLDEDLVITIKRIPGGLVSNHIHDNWQEGDLVEFLRPVGSFVTEFATKNRREVVCIAGGSGITPVISILKGVLFQEPYSRVNLLYSNKNKEEIIFRKELDELSKKFPKRFRLTHVLTRSSEGFEEEHLKGRLDESRIGKWLDEDEPELEREYFICGPQGLIQTAEACLHTRKVSPLRIKKEAFVSSLEMEQRQNRTLLPAREVRVKLGNQTHNFWVPSGATILEAALSQGIALPYSCKRGNCATCMGKILQGKVEMNDPSALLEFEIEAGKVLTCQAIPAGEGIEIQIGN